MKIIITATEVQAVVAFHNNIADAIKEHAGLDIEHIEIKPQGVLVYNAKAFEASFDNVTGLEVEIKTAFVLDYLDHTKIVATRLIKIGKVLEKVFKKIQISEAAFKDRWDL